jgi:hypothetical protein
MAITSEQRDLALAHLSQLAYSSNIAEYDLNLEVLQSSRMPLVVEYFLANWDNIRHEWVVGLTAQLLTLDQRTTNRLENINKQIKDTVTCLAALPAFFSEFFLYLASSRSERDQRAAIMIDTPVRSADPIELQFKEHLTDYAWKQMAEQFELAKQLSEAVTPDSRPNHQNIFEVGIIFGICKNNVTRFVFFCVCYIEYMHAILFHRLTEKMVSAPTPAHAAFSRKTVFLVDIFWLSAGIASSTSLMPHFFLKDGPGLTFLLANPFLLPHWCPLD